MRTYTDMSEERCFGFFFLQAGKVAARKLVCYNNGYDALSAVTNTGPIWSFTPKPEPVWEKRGVKRISVSLIGKLRLRSLCKHSKGVQ